MFILLAGCSKQCRECWNVLLIFDFKNYFAWFWANNGIVRNESHDIFSWIYTANCFIMTIFLPFFAYFVICELTGQVRFFNKGFNRKKNAAKLQNCFTTLNSRFYPEIFFQSMKKVSPPVFYRVCTMVWHVYWVRHVYCTWHCFKHWQNTQTRYSSTTPRKCCVGGCNSSCNTENEHVKVHRFLSDPDGKQRWINALVNILPKEPTQGMVVCIKHWPSNY